MEMVFIGNILQISKKRLFNFFFFFHFDVSGQTAGKLRRKLHVILRHDFHYGHLLKQTNKTEQQDW